MERAIKVFTESVELYVDRSVDRVLASGVAVYASMPRHVLGAAIGRAFATVTEDVRRGTAEAYPAYMRQAGTQRAKNGTPIGEMIRGLAFGFQVVSDHFKEAFANDLEARLWWEERRHEISYAGALAVMDAFYVTREEIIAEQTRQIMALSAPVLPLSTGILLLPIVGSLDERRAALVIEALLQGIARHRSQVVIIDVTGMLAVEETATAHLLRAAQAGRLLGAKIILVGIRPDVALTLARAEADLEDITIRADLTRGVELALRLRDTASAPIRRSRRA